MVSNKPPTSEGNKRTGNQMANRQRFKQGMMNKPYNPTMNSMRNMSAMFNANQLGDDPGFVDFNDDSVASTTNGTGSNIGGTNASASNVTDGGNKPFANGNRRMNPPMKRPMKNGGPPGGMRNRMNGGANGMPNWGHPMPPPNMFPGPPGPAGRRGPMNPPPIPPPVPPAHFRNGPGMRMRGPQNGRYGAGMPGPMSLLSMNRPLPPPIPPMNARPMPPPPCMGRMMPPPQRHGLDGPMRRNMNGNMHARGMGGKMGPFARNGMAPNGGAIGMNGKRARAKPAQLQNREEYPLDKPWVTAEIKAEHDKKAELANRLKGHRDDALFAQFKEQRDKFVKMYEAARLEYIGKHPEQDVDKILTAPACKKARLENVEKTNAATDNTTAKTEETTSSSSSNSSINTQVVDTAATTTISTDPSTNSTKSDANSCSTVASSPATSAANTTTIDTNDSTEITSTSSKDEQLSIETEASPTAIDATVESNVPV